jgi:hypothetical protein
MEDFMGVTHFWEVLVEAMEVFMEATHFWEAMGVHVDFMEATHFWEAMEISVGVEFKVA